MDHILYHAYLVVQYIDNLSHDTDSASTDGRNSIIMFCYFLFPHFSALPIVRTILNGKFFKFTQNL